jgi:TonB family protein
MAAVVGISKSAVPSSPRNIPKLQLIVQLEPAHRVFFSNLREFFRRESRLSSAPVSAQFWPDVFVVSRLPWAGFLESALWHAVMLAALWVFSQVWLARPQLIRKNTFSRSEVLYYSPSEYLPSIDTGRAATHMPQEGSPEFAKQPIISIAPESDNRTQTIVTPPDVKLAHEVAVPNIVAWNQATPSAPLSASTPSRRLDVPEITPVAPAPELNQAASRRIAAPANAVVAPAPELTGVATRSLASPQVSVVAPPPAIPSQLRNFGDINIGPSVVAPSPQLPMPEQRTSAAAAVGIAPASAVPPPPSLTGIAHSSRGRVDGIDGHNTHVVPPPPSVPATDASVRGGRLIALGIHPSATPPPDGLLGNRRGTFAVSREGKVGASGTPQISGDASSRSNGAGHDTANAGGIGSGSDASIGVPEGIHVGAGPNDSSSSARTGHRDLASLASSGSFGPLAADNHPMRVTVIPRGAGGSDRPPTEMERSIFHDRRSYSMILNMPNLNSVGGSWIIRFAEKTQSDNSSELTVPQATRKVDPGYPTELMRENVQGTVILYAIIRSDGTVGDVRVLSSVDERLDQFARAALGRWQFKPATRNGIAVDLDAVVTIPFRAKSSF